MLIVALSVAYLHAFFFDGELLVSVKTAIAATGSIQIPALGQNTSYLPIGQKNVAKIYLHSPA